MMNGKFDLRPCLAGILGLCLLPALGAFGDTDLSDNDDLLYGQRLIGRADDGILAAPMFLSNSVSGGIQAGHAVRKGEDGLPQADPMTISSEEVLCQVTYVRGDGVLVAAQAPLTALKGRFFDSTRDHSVAIYPKAPDSNLSGPCGQDGTRVIAELYDPYGTGSDPIASTTLATEGATGFVGAVADFNRDGYDDLLLVTVGDGSSTQQDALNAFILTAVDVGDPSQGFAAQQVLSLAVADDDFATQLAQKPAVGDFDGDGVLEVALYYKAPDAVPAISFYKVCASGLTACTTTEGFVTTPVGSPIPVSGFSGANVANATADVAGGHTSHSFAMAAGNYSIDGGTGLFVTYITNAANPSWTWRLYGFDANMAWTLANSVERTTTSCFGGPAFAVSEPLDFTSALDQFVMTCGSALNGGSLVVARINADNDLLLSQTSWEFDINQSDWEGEPYGLAIGRFAALPTGEQGQTGAQASFAPQIAVIQPVTLADSGELPTKLRVRVYDVSPSDNSLTLSDRLDQDILVVSVNDQALLPSRNGWIAAGDLQGRSLRVGEPQIVRMVSTQPSVVLGAPPYHKDWLPLADLPSALFSGVTGKSRCTPGALSGQTSSGSCVVNMSVVASDNTGFISQYDLSETASSQSDHSHTTSWNVSGQETASFGNITKQFFGFGIPFGFNWSFTAQQKHSEYVESLTNTYETQAFDASTKTGYGDQVWYQQMRYNLYFYPVLGETACPGGATSCDATEEVPVVLILAGPDQITNNTVNGNLVEWYQPVHEPGQVFSYPWSLELLEQQLGVGPELLTSDDAIGFFTDSSARTEYTSWTAGSTSGEKVGKSSSYTESTSFGFTWGDPKLDTPGTTQGGVGFSVGGSDSTSDLTTTLTTIGESTGVLVQKPGTMLQPIDFAYRVAPFIFGQERDPNVLPDVVPDAGVQTAGALQTYFVADVTDQSGGGGTWWQSADSPYLNDIDIALNRPQSYSAGVVKLSSGAAPAECLFNSFDVDRVSCIVPAWLPLESSTNPCTSQLWTSGFYSLRGFFITESGAGGGQQRSMVTAGTELDLSVRVYNYSLRDMPTGTRVQVRFYGQEWDTNGNVPIGDSFLIGEETVADPLPGFNSDSAPDTPNWTLVTTTWDTTDFADKYVVFWVVVWAQTGSGELVEELPDHGLTGIPDSTLASACDAPVETVSMQDPDGGITSRTTSFSNNVGLYKLAFYVAPAEDSGLDTVAPADAITVENVRACPCLATVDETIEVSADVVSVGGKTEGTVVELYDQLLFPGDSSTLQDDSPSLFDLEHIAHLRADEPHQVRVPYRPKSCGLHELTFAADPGTPNESAASKLLKVSCKDKLGRAERRLANLACGCGKRHEFPDRWWKLLKRWFWWRSNFVWPDYVGWSRIAP